MRHLNRCVAGLVVVGALAATAFAVAVRQATIGTEVIATFPNDVGSKPKIELTYVDVGATAPKAKAKVLSANGNEVSFVIQAANGGGTFQVGLKGSDDTAGVVVLVPPRVASADKAVVAAGGDLVLEGSWFGEDANKRNAPKVYVNGKKAKSKAFTNDRLEIELHKSTPAGLADITITNKVGETTFNGVVTVTPAPKPVKGKDNVSATIGGRKLKAKNSKKDPEGVTAVLNPGGELVIGAGKSSGSTYNRNIAVLAIAVDVGVGSFDELTLPATFTGNLVIDWSFLNIKSTKSFPPVITQTSEVYLGGTDTGCSVTIHAWDGERFSFSFGGTLENLGLEGPATVQIQNGSGVLTLQQ